MSVTITFSCGHKLDVTGNEQEPRCFCGCATIDLVAAPPPKFTGHAHGPCSNYKNLPATAVELKGN